MVYRCGAYFWESHERAHAIRCRHRASASWSRRVPVPVHLDGSARDHAHVLDHEAEYTFQTYGIAATTGMANVLGSDFSRFFGSDIPTAAKFGLAVLVGPLLGLAGVFVGGFMSSVIGRMLGAADAPLPDHLLLPSLAVLIGATIMVIGGVWSLVTMTKCVAEAHRFSAWRALAIPFHPAPAARGPRGNRGDPLAIAGRAAEARRPSGSHPLADD